MNAIDLLHKIANELPVLASQVRSDNLILRAAGAQRLDDLAAMTAPYRRPTHQRAHTRRAVLAAGASFLAMSVKPDD